MVRHDRAVVVAGVVIVTVLCWAWIVPMARDMYGAMNGPSAWMMTGTWDASHIMLLWAMWALMMAGMMLPSATPILLIYAGLLRQRHPEASPLPPASAMAAGYLAVWAVFSAGATLLQRLLAGWLVLTPMMELGSQFASGVVLVAAGVYQLTPLKWRCLRGCRSPLSTVFQHWRPGSAGALRMGIEHGMYCLGCCWALMLLLFVGGVMNLSVIVALTILVGIEKLAPAGRYVSGATGIVLVALGGAVVLGV